MSTAYTLPTQSVIEDALEHLGVLAVGQTASAEDYAVALKGLQNILKELPIHGLSWPKVTMPSTALLWSALTPSIVAMPIDYYGSPTVTRFTDNGSSIGRTNVYVISKAEYDLLQQEYIDPLANPSLEPQRIYIAPNNVGYLWPIPSVNPLLSITYQAITNDAVLNASPDVAQTWVGGMGLWLANEIATKFSVDLATRADIERRFMMRRSLMLAHATETAPIYFEVID